MCFSSKQRRIPNFIENRMTGFPVKFDENEMQQLQKKFDKVAGNKKTIDLESFQNNMGILGLSSFEGFSGRLFNSFDTDEDGKISFQDFVEYMEAMKYGNKPIKAKISFKLINPKKEAKITVKEFKDFLDDYFKLWASINNCLITPEIKQKTDQYVDELFRRVKAKTNKDYIDFAYYCDSVFEDEKFLQILKFITESITNVFVSGQKIGEEGSILYRVLKNIRQIHYSLVGQAEPNAISSPQHDLFQGYNSFIGDPDTPLHKFNVMQEQVHELQSPPVTANDRFNRFRKESHPSSRNLGKTQAHNSKTVTNDYTARTSEAFPIRQEFRKEVEQKCAQCSNCLRIEVLEKKIQFLTSKLKAIIEDTQKIYSKLDEQLYQKQMEKKNAHDNNIYEKKKPTPENMIFFGDQNWNIVLNMMIGIQMAVRSVRGYQEMYFQEPKDFNLKYYFELVPRRYGSRNALSSICSFSDYAPNTFNHIRKLFAIDNEQYIDSIGPNRLIRSLILGEVSSLSGLTSQGKSGSFFYYTADNKYMLKTIQYREYRHLRKILPDYYAYVKENPNTLITKFFGLHKLIEKDSQGEMIGKIYFVIMANVFNTTEKIEERFDLKGSSYGRQTNSNNKNVTKKDNDFLRKKKPIQLDPRSRDELMENITKDARFFRDNNIIDYSLLIGVIKKNIAQDSPTKLRRSPERGKMEHTKGDKNNDLKQSHMYTNLAQNQQYIFGIIDILTEYDTRKAAQYYFKSTCYGQGVSAVPPDDYCNRFIHFMDTKVLDKTDKPPRQSIVSAPKQQTKKSHQKSDMQLAHIQSRDSFTFNN